MSSGPTLEKRHMGMSASNRLSNTIIYIILIVMSVIWLAPFVFIVLQSFRVESTWMTGYVVPRQFGLDNYINLAQTDFWHWYTNTFIAALVTAVLHMAAVGAALATVMGQGLSFIISLIGLTVILSAFGLDLPTSLAAVTACITNVGVGAINIIGPSGNYAFFSDSVKAILCFAMLLGRLEIITLLVVATKSFWHK